MLKQNKGINETLDHVVCLHCNAEDDYTLKETSVNVSIDKDNDIIVNCKVPYCNKCDQVIEVDSITREVIESAKEKYQRASQLFNK